MPRESSLAGHSTNYKFIRIDALFESLNDKLFPLLLASNLGGIFADCRQERM
jgi:hypothetical protein